MWEFGNLQISTFPNFHISKLPEFCRAAKARELILIQLAPVADRDVLVDDRPDAHAAEPPDGVADRLEHPAHLPLPSLVQDHLDERVLGARLGRFRRTIGEADLRGRRPAAV